MSPSHCPVTPERFDAVLFDLDGVLTDTAKVHAACWKKMFDEFLRNRVVQTGEPFRPFDIDTDYKRYMDGKLRYEGVRSFLHSRGIHLPDGDPGDPAHRETICGLGNRKNDLIQEVLATDGVEVYDRSLPFMHLISFTRVLDMQAGTLERDVVWEMPSGKQVRVKSCRFVSFEHRHLAAIAYEVTVLNATAPVVISSEMVYNPVSQTAASDPRTARGFTERPLFPQKQYANGERILLSHATKNSKLVAGQESDILLITCADSRVVPDQLVSTDPGALFVMRNAGNLIPRGCARNSAITNPPNRRHASHCIAHLAVP